MLEPGDELRFAFEATDECRIVGEVRVDHFHCDIAAHARLRRSVHDTESTLTELLAELVAAECTGCGSFVETWVSGCDQPLELDQLARGFQADLVDEMGPIGLERPERVSLTTVPVQRQHELVPRPLAQRELDRQPFELADRCGRLAAEE